MSNTEIPQRWADRLVAKGFTDGRYKEDVPSLTALASAMNVHTSTVSKIIRGRSTPTAANIAGLVNALGEDVAEWLGVEYHGPWVPPEDAVLLDPRQRKALEELIVSITSKKAESTHGSTDQAPEEEKTGDRPVTDDKKAGTGDGKPPAEKTPNEPVTAEEPKRSDYTTAARRIKSTGRAQAEEHRKLGEESQIDPNADEGGA